MVTEAQLDDYIATHRADVPSTFSRSFWREQAEASQHQHRQVQAKSTEAAEIKQLRERVRRLERMVLGEKAILLKAVGRAIGQTHKAIDGQLKAIEDREPIPISLPVLDQHDRPTMRYAGIWSATKAYQPGDLATYNGSGWVAQIGSKGLRPGDGTGWKLAVKGDPSRLKGLVQAEVHKQLQERR